MPIAKMRVDKSNTIEAATPTARNKNLIIVKLKNTLRAKIYRRKSN